MIRPNRETGELEARCCTCKGWFPVKSFAKDKNRKDGIDPRCKMCNNDRKADYRARKRMEAVA